MVSDPRLRRQNYCGVLIEVRADDTTQACRYTYHTYKPYRKISTLC